MDKEQMQELLKNEKTFSASEMFLHTNHMVFNSETILKAERITVEQMKEKKKAATEKATGDELRIKNEASTACELLKLTQ